MHVERLCKHGIAAISGVVSHEEIKVPMRRRSAMTEILKLHNSPNPIKPQDIEEMGKNGALDHLKAEDETIVSEIIALTHEVYNTDEYAGSHEPVVRGPCRS